MKRPKQPITKREKRARRRSRDRWRDQKAGLTGQTRRHNGVEPNTEPRGQERGGEDDE